MNLKIHIERLILDGLPVTTVQGAELQAAVKSELERLLGDGGSGRLPELHRGVVLDRAGGETIRLAGGDKSSNLGFQIAGAVHRGLAESFSSHSEPLAESRSGVFVSGAAGQSTNHSATR